MENAIDTTPASEETAAHSEERELPELIDSDEKPHLVIRPSAGWQFQNIPDLWHYRDLLVTLGVRRCGVCDRRLRLQAHGAEVCGCDLKGDFTAEDAEIH